MADSASMQDTRITQLIEWLGQLPLALQSLAIEPASLQPASADASFRRYFRLTAAGAASGSVIVMDAPPDKEDVAPFLGVTAMLQAAGVNVPSILYADQARGFLLLSDFGGTTMLAHMLQSGVSQNAVTAPSAVVSACYEAALRTLVQIQQTPPSLRQHAAGHLPHEMLRAEQRPPDVVLPVYDAARLDAEMALFQQWYVERHLGYTMTPAERAGHDALCRMLCEACLSDPCVFVHRDYHSRNLMVWPSSDNERRGGMSPGVLDYQDAVLGPISYDLVSLLRDAYIAWPEEQVRTWVDWYREQARAAGLPASASSSAFYQQFEWVGLQRQLKVLGIFARLHHRDGKSGYLGDIPRVLQYARGVAERYQHDYEPMADLAALFERLAGCSVDKNER